MPWEDLFRSVVDESADLVKSEIADLLKGLATDAEQSIRDRGSELQTFLEQLENGAITKEEFEMYAKKIERQLRMDELRIAVEAKVRAQRLADGLKNIILDRMMKLL